MMEIPLNAWLTRNGKTQAELALAIGLNRPTLCRKVNNVRPWKQDEINAVLAFCRQYEPGVTYEELFGVVEAEPVQEVS